MLLSEQTLLHCFPIYEPISFGETEGDEVLRQVIRGHYSHAAHPSRPEKLEIGKLCHAEQVVGEEVAHPAQQHEDRSRMWLIVGQKEKKGIDGSEIKYHHIRRQQIDQYSILLLGFIREGSDQIDGGGREEHHTEGQRDESASKQHCSFCVLPKGEKVDVVEDVIQEEQPCPHREQFITSVLQHQVSADSEHHPHDDDAQRFFAAIPEDQAHYDDQWRNFEVCEPVDLE